MAIFLIGPNLENMSRTVDSSVYTLIPKTPTHFEGGGLSEVFRLPRRCSGDLEPYFEGCGRLPWLRDLELR